MVRGTSPVTTHLLACPILSASKASLASKASQLSATRDFRFNSSAFLRCTDKRRNTFLRAA